MKIIKTKKGHEIIVDDKYYDELIKYNWRVDVQGYVVYSKGILSRKESRETGKPRKKSVRMHRMIIELEHNIVLDSGTHIDHIDRIPLNNQLDNLRICWKGTSINQINVGLRKDNTTGYKGVKFKKSTERYESYVDFRGKRHYAGSSKNIDIAAELYNIKALELHGESAYLNVIKK
jgi:hypothetical protein